MRAILVCVDYSDYLAITLPRNRHHFSEVFVITTEDDEATQAVARENRAEVVTTDLFYRDGASFNKFRALEHGLDVMGRDGWVSVMDADVIWPHVIDEFKPGHLTTPYRRMCYADPTPSAIDESVWNRYRRHLLVRHWSGYSHVFHAYDPMLVGRRHWYPIDWRHAGGGDTDFQSIWPEHLRCRPSWECLHLGEPATNWQGRVTSRLDGSMPPETQNRRERQLKLFSDRRVARGSMAAERLTLDSQIQK